MLVPKLFTTLRGYTRAQFGADVGAGVVVGIVALPLALAFAIASGVTPGAGLWTAVVGGLLISVLGGSRVQIGGPTGAFVVIVYGIVQQYGVDGLAVATMMAGAILVILGLARFGGAIKFIPQPVVVGFTSGIAVVIFAGQVKDALGLSMGVVPAAFVEKWRAYAAHADAVNPWAVTVFACTLGILWLWPKVSHRVPGPFVALVAGAALAHLGHLPVDTIGTRFGALAGGFPSLRVPHVSGAQALLLVGPAFTIALLAAIESLLSAVVADGMIGGRHRSNMELVAQGIANLAVPLVGGIPATGAIARTATNVKSGGRTPVAGIVHALTLLAITLFVGRWTTLVPMPVLAAILVTVAYHMSEWRTFLLELRAPRSDVAVLLVTFGLTVFVDLTVAIEVGMVLAAFLFIRRMAEVTNVSVVTREFQEADDDYDTDPNAVGRRTVPPGVEVYEVNGPFFFGAAETFREALRTVAAKPRVLIVRMRNVPAIDATGLHVLRDLIRSGRRDGLLVLLSDVHAQPLLAMARAEILDEVGEEHLFGNVDDALNRAREHLGIAPEARPGFAVPTVKRESAPGGDPAPTA